MEFFMQLYVRPPPDDSFPVNLGFESSPQKILKICYFFICQPTPNFVSQIDANQRYFQLPSNGQNPLSMTKVIC